MYYNNDAFKEGVNMNDTIAAIATTLGVGAISIIRVSGDESISIVDKIFSKCLKDKKTYTLSYGNILNNNEIIDEVIVSIMKKPNSYTGENVVEINCHGGIATTKIVLELLLKNGCRLAEPGEFTKRRFLNGKIDLTQADAIMNLINVKNENARKIAINNLQGNTTNKIKELREILINIISNIEVNIDYPEYLDIEEITRENIEEKLSTIEEELTKIIKNSKNSKIINNGVNIAIVGRPNVGKSSILNKLLEEDKAIVTDIAGTTRDIVEGSIILDNMLLNFIDTAGIRKTTDKIEQIGVNKSFKILENADLIILVLNNNEKITDEDKELLDKTKTKKRIIVINKDDLDKKLELKEENIIYTNTLNYEGIESLKNKIKEMFYIDEIDSNDFNYVSNIEQINRLEEAKLSLDDIKQGLSVNIEIDMLEIDLKSIWNILGEIIGETYTEELLDNLFKNFCVGK